MTGIRLTTLNPAVTDWQGWLSAIGGPVAALGLALAAYELRAGRAERADKRRQSIRLITIERVKSDNELLIRFGVYNHSDAPVFELRLDRVGYIARRDDGKIRPIFPDAEFIGQGDGSGGVTVRTMDTEPVFAASASIWESFEWSYPEWYNLADVGTDDPDELLKFYARVDYGVTISFLDSHGRRWQRTNTAPPMRLNSREELPWWHRRCWWPRA